MQSPEFSSTNSKSRKTDVPENDCNSQITSNAKDINTFNGTKDKGFNDAMQALLDNIGELETDKSNKINKRHNVNETLLSNDNMSTKDNKQMSPMTTRCDTSTSPKLNNNLHWSVEGSDTSGTDDLTDSIERLQQRQSDVQKQLDHHLLIAKQLMSKVVETNGIDLIDQEKSKSSMIEESHGKRVNEIEDNDDDDELAEFEQVEMQIDNELRISELNRQLDDIQEELRLKLFNKLLSNMNRNGKMQQNDLEIDSKKRERHDAAIGQQSASSSSCSTDQPTTSITSSSNSTGISRSNLPSKTLIDCNNKIVDVVDAAGNDEDEQNIYSEPASESQTHDGTINANGEFLTNYKIEQNPYTTTSNSNTPTNFQSDLDSVVDNINGFAAMTPTTSKESIGSSSKKSPPNELTTSVTNYTQPVSMGTLGSSEITTSCAQYSTLTFPSSHRNSSANSDLARIEEDEEDSQDYCDSGHFRTIYEEKFSPLINGYNLDNRDQIVTTNYLEPNNQPNMSDEFSQEDFSSGVRNKQNLMQAYSAGTVSGRGVYPSNNSSFNEAGSSSNVSGGSSRRTGSINSSSVRPLTMYLPKPDEDIDLVDHIQALGHDIDIISADLKISPTNAQGYLWKCCSNNNKKWLKRYFFFDRNSKVLTYFENKDHLVKKHNAPKNCIPFSEISDVYVDHKLSGIGQKERSSKRKHYVFVLATVARNYLLASSKAELMRAWIDVLFTAAKANDYFQQLAAIESEDDDDELKAI